MATLLLIGPQTMGKTTIFNSARGEENPDKMETTTVITHKWIKFYTKSIRDTPGEDTTSRNNLKLKELIEQDTYIAFVFNSLKLINELDHPEKGGQITSAIGILWKEWNNIDNEGKKLFFIGTFADQVGGDNAARKIIRDKLKGANEYYVKIAGQPRYPYSGHFLQEAWFRCLNATDPKQVEKIVNFIFQ